MEILTIMVVSSAMQDKCEGYKINVNKNSYLLFESKKHYKKIMKLEKSLVNLVKYVLSDGINKEIYEREKARQREFKLKCELNYGCAYESDSDSDSDSEKIQTYNWALKDEFYLIEEKIKKFPLMKVNIYEINDDLDGPFEIMFPTLVYFFMTNHYKQKGYTN